MKQKLEQLDSIFFGIRKTGPDAAKRHSTRCASVRRCGSNCCARFCTVCSSLAL